MKKKIIMSVVAILILTAAIVAIIMFNNKLNGGRIQSYNSIEEAEKEAAFSMQHPDRLCGVPATGFKANSGMIEVLYGDSNYIRKTLGVKDNSGNTAKFKEKTDLNINGMDVTLSGDGGLYSLAVWNDNNFGFTVSTNEGITADEMAEYIETTK